MLTYHKDTTHLTIYINLYTGLFMQSDAYCNVNIIYNRASTKINIKHNINIIIKSLNQVDAPPPSSGPHLMDNQEPLSVLRYSPVTNHNRIFGTFH